MRKKLLFLLVGVLLLAVVGCSEAVIPQEVEIKLRKMSFNAEELIMGVGDTSQLEIALDPIDATKGRVLTLASDNADKASINETFLVTAKEVGETNIVATSSFGGIQAKVRVVIVPKLSEGIDVIIALRGEQDTVYLTNDITITNDDLALVGYDSLLMKKPKTIIGRGFKIDMSAIEVASADVKLIDIIADEAVSFKDINFIFPSVFSALPESAINDPNSVLTKSNCTFTVK